LLQHSKIIASFNDLIMTIMHINKKISATICLLAGVVLLASMTFIQQPPQQRPPDLKVTNLKVLPKNLTFRQVDHIMDDWAASLGVRCTFCHVRNEETKKMDFANDAKPEKKMARHMYTMAIKINKKFFKSNEKDSLGVAKFASVNCNTCHHGVAHIEVSIPKRGGGPGPAPAPEKKS
jgi:hypothetical protein